MSRIVRAVGRLDPDDAAVLVSFTLGELAMDYDEIVQMEERSALAKALPDLRKALVRTFVSKRAAGEPVDDLVRVAAELTLAESELVSKAPRAWRESDVRRDERGRFSREFNSSSDRIPHKAMKSPHWGPDNMKQLMNAGRGRRQLDSYAEDWARLNGEVEGLRSTGAIDRGAQVNVVLQHSNGRRSEIPANADDMRSAAWDPKQQQPVGYNWSEGSPMGLSPDNRPTLANLGQSLNMTAAAERPNEYRYQQVGMAGQATRQLTRPGTLPHTVGTIASVVGEIGPQAEEAIGPTMRRTAYRYRGNEVRPSPGVVGAVEQVDEVPMILADELPVGSDPATSPGAAKLRSNTPAQSAVAMYDKEFAGNPARIAMHGRSDQAVIELVDDIPTPEQYELGLSAGTPPPSTGVMIDSQGRVAHQAVGYEGDHYLPFNLRNLKALSGGQYVRTRGTGGPTSEDVYTGLMGNARMVTVASRNGVFTLEFAPEARGSKRYSDKARRMIRRYEQILDAVDTSGGGRLRRTQIPEETLDRIKQRTWTRANGKIDEYKRMLEIEIEKEQFKLDQGIGADKKALREQATAEVQQGYSGQAWSKLPNATREGMVSERMRSLSEEQGATGGSYRLNGPGYASALSALQRQFPDLIKRVDYRTLKDFGDNFGLGAEFAQTAQPSRGARDKGYVLPGSNKPHEATVGWWNPNITRGSGNGNGENPDLDLPGDSLPRASGPHSKQRGTWAEPGLTHRRPAARAGHPPETRVAGGAGGAGAGPAAPRSAGGPPGSAGTGPGGPALNPNGLAAALLGQGVQAIPMIQQQLPIFSGVAGMTPLPENADIVPIDPPDLGMPVAQASVAQIRTQDFPVRAKWMLSNANLSQDDPRMAEALRDPEMVKGLTVWMKAVANRLRDPRTQSAFAQQLGIGNLQPDTVANELERQAGEIEALTAQSQPLRGGNPLFDDPTVSGQLRPVVTETVDSLPPDARAVGNHLDHDADQDVRDLVSTLEDDTQRDDVVAEHRKMGRRLRSLVKWQEGPQAAYPGAASGLGADDFRAMGLTQQTGQLTSDDLEDVAANAAGLAEAVKAGDLSGLPDVNGATHPVALHGHRAEALALYAAGKSLAGESIPKVSKGLGRSLVPLRQAGRPQATSFPFRGRASKQLLQRPVAKRSVVVHDPSSPLARAVASRLT